MLTKRQRAVALSISILTLTTCSIPATGDIKENITPTQSQIAPKQNIMNYMVEKQQYLMEYMLEKQQLYEARKEMAKAIAKAKDHRENIDFRISNLEQYVDKTWYVFSGSTPAGWDCSGLTKWFYEYFDLELEHRASKQELSGKQVDSPMPGDLVVFKYLKSKNAYHVGIYTGQDLMIHAPREGKRTAKESISEFASDHSNVFYFRMLETD